MARISVLGSANLDLVVRLPRAPLPGETVFGAEFATVPGGKGLNQAIAAARAGADVAFLGAVGRDEFAAPVRGALVANDVNVSRLVDVDAPTGIASIYVDDAGENSIVVVSGANSAHDVLSDEDHAVIEASEALLTQFERPLPLIEEAMRVARAAGVRTVLTPAPVLPFSDELLDLVDVLVPNAIEARTIAGVDDDVEAARRISERVDTVLMTRGAKGQLVARGGTVVAEYEAYRTEAVDTTAAGDTFVGIFAARSVRGEADEAAIRAASVGAGISVTRPGASSSMPTWAEIDAILATL